MDVHIDMQSSEPGSRGGSMGE
eukprot:COSAG06_NODE_33771_length_484_cov_1.002597_1_plen_21_part_10